MPAAELYLAGGALAFYLLDSALFLYGNELVFVHSRSGWRNVAASEALFFGRRVLLPNPLTPFAPLLRVWWSESVSRGAPPARAAAPGLPRALRPLQAGVMILLLLIAVVLPALLFFYGQGLLLLGLLVSVYALNIAMTFWIWWHRTVLGLATRSCTILTVDLLACPPFAINLVRKITMQQPPAGDPLLFARAQFTPAGFTSLCLLLARRIRQELAADEPGGERYRKLEALQQRLVELDSCPPAN